MADALDVALASIRSIQQSARDGRRGGRAAALADDRAAQPQGLDRARRKSTARRSKAFGARIRCRSRTAASNPDASENARGLDAQLSSRKSCSTRTAALIPNCRHWRPTGNRRMGANPHANGGLLKTRARSCPDFRAYAIDVAAPGGVDGRSDARAGQIPARRHPPQRRGAQFPHHGSGRNRVQPARRGVRGNRSRLDGGDRTL